ncbi:neprilysin-2-like [Cochliomyia hominivorax]
MLQNQKLLFGLICLLLIAINHTEQRQNSQGQQQSRSHQVQSLQLEQRLIHEREQKAQEILKYMNLEGEPCKDFFDYVCGNWMREQDTRFAQEGDLFSVQSFMEQEVNKQLQNILDEPTTSQDSLDARVAKDFYKSCLRVAAFSPAQRQFMQNFVLEHGGLPDLKGSQWQSNYNWIYIIADLRRKYGMDILIGLTIDRSNPNHKGIYLEEPQTTLLPVELCSSLATREIDENDQAFDRIQNQVKNNLRKWFEFNESDALRIAGSIIRFEFDLCKYMRLDQTVSTPLDTEDEQQSLIGNRRGYPARMVENKIHGVRQSATNSLQNLRSLSETFDINFKEFVDQSLETSTISQVNFRNEEYFQQLSTIAKKGLQASFANYIMYRALSELNFPPNERHAERPFYCVNSLMRYMPQVLGKIYSEKYNNEEIKQDVLEVFTIIRQSFSQHLKINIQWMTENTKKAVNQKLKTLKLHFPIYPQNVDLLRGIQFHDVLRGHSHDDKNYWQKLVTIMMFKANQTVQQVRLTNDHSNIVEAHAVNIQSKPLTQDLVVGYGLLQKPFYSQFHAASLKYSSIGVSIAREMLKMFDYQGLHQNPMNTFPWDPVTMNSFSLINECFRAQMSNYFHNNPNVFRNASKLRDIILESSAISVAFNAYLYWLEGERRTHTELMLETLPNINFTNTQLFFINSAQMHCAARHHNEEVPEFLPLYRRSMEQYDVNGPLCNSVEFSRDYNCELGVDMNLDDKCLLY